MRRAPEVLSTGGEAGTFVSAADFSERFERVRAMRSAKKAVLDVLAAVDPDTHRDVLLEILVDLEDAQPSVPRGRLGRLVAVENARSVVELDRDVVVGQAVSVPRGRPLKLEDVGVSPATEAHIADAFGVTNGVATTDKPTAALRAEKFKTANIGQVEEEEVAEGAPRPTEMNGAAKRILEALQAGPKRRQDLDPVGGTVGKTTKALQNLVARGLIKKGPDRFSPWSLA
jgi:hypothetical protein